MNFYRVLRDNLESGPFSLDELKKFGLKSSDLIWVDGESASWKFPDEVDGLIAKVEGKTETSSPAIKNNPSPKKRYRLTADHKMVEITEDEAESSDIPRVAEQPPAPIIESKLEEELTSTPFSKPISKITEPEPFAKKDPIAEEIVEKEDFPIEPELEEKQKADKKSDFVDFEPEKEENLETDTNDEMKKNSNAGAFIFAGLLFLVAIGFFGYKYYSDKNAGEQDVVVDNADSSTSVEEGQNHPVMTGGKIGIADDTTGTAERAASQKQYRDSIEKIRAARVKTEALRAKAADTVKQPEADIALDEATPEKQEPAKVEKPKVDTASNDGPKKVTIDPITGKSELDEYVRIGVVNPPQKTGGVKGMKLVVHNVSKRNIMRVRINLLYFNNAGLIVKRKSIVAPNIKMGGSVTMPVEDDASATLVSYKIAGILGDHVNLQR